MSRAIRFATLALANGSAALGLGLGLALASVAHASYYPYSYTNFDRTKTIIPSHPTRVAVYGGPEIVLDLLASLGVKPIAYQDDSYPDYTPGASVTGRPYWVDAGELNGVHAIIGGSTGPNYEEIAAYHPDLIITSHMQYAPELDAIAPTISGYTLAGSSENLSPGSKHFYADNDWTSLAAVFNDTPRMSETLGRLHDRTIALSGFAKGISVSLPEFAPGQDFYLTVSDESLGGIFDSAGAKIESIPGPSTFAGGEFQLVSYELLDRLTATKVVAEPAPPNLTVAEIEALPLYNDIPAVKTHQFYFTNAPAYGPIGTADAITSLAKQVYGVTGLEATLAKPGKKTGNPYDVADVDVGPTEKRVCWDIATASSIGHPNATVIENAKGVKLFALAHGYHTTPTQVGPRGSERSDTGCMNVKKSAGKKLLASTKYIVAVKKSAKVLLQGNIVSQGPAFFGDGEDKQYNLAGTSGPGNTGTTGPPR